MYKSNKHTILDHLLVQYHYTTILFNFGQFKFSLEPQFISNVKKYTEIDELTLEILNELIEKIIIHQTEKINGKKVQEIDIYYKGIGIISFPVSINDIEVTIEKILNKKTA